MQIRARYPTLFKMLPWAVTVLVFAVSAFALIGFGPPTDFPAAELAIFMAAFVVGHALLIQQDVRGMRISFNLTDIPLIVALFYLDPFWVVSIKILASSVYYARRYIREDVGVLKPLFNIANTGAGTAVAAFFVQEVGLGAATQPRTWLVLVGAIVITGFVTTILISLMLFALAGRESVLKAWSGFVLTMTGPLISSCVGLIFLLLLDATLWSGVLLGMAVIALILLTRRFAALRRQRQILADLNEFTQLVVDSVRSRRLVDAMLGRLREILAAESATVWVPVQGRYPEIRLTSGVDDAGLTDLDPVPADLQREIMASGESALITPKHGPREQFAMLEAAGVKCAMLVPLRSGAEVYGCLSVADRIGGELSHFIPVDLQLLQTIAANVSIAVQNERLFDQLHYDAYHDPLTGLSNRRRSLEAIEEAIGITVPDEVVAVLMFDVDGMHEINDALGHEAGDALLVEFARRLETYAPDASFIGRIDSDEFILQTRLASTAEAAESARRLREQIEGPFEFGGVAVDVSAVVGVVTHPDFATDADELLQRADAATRQAKQSSTGVQVYHSGLESESLRRIGLAADLRRAMERDEIEVHYQPKGALATGTLVGAEALVRWNHPMYGHVAPEEFVAIAGSTGQLAQLTERVLEDALARAAEWGGPDGPLPMAVNLSPRTVADTAFPDRVEEMLERSGIPPERMTFEITEDDMVADGARLTPVLDRLHEMGVRLSVDDFGTGYSSLAYLRRLPVQEIKIDLRFVQGMATDADDRAIVRAVIGLARHFDIDVVAEGVESRQTVAELQAMECEIGQGYYFSRPLPPDRFSAWIESEGGRGGASGLRVV
jgi:diguanylate cyclase (GGDEF)-like protein